MAVTVFGALEADQIDRLVELADAIFAEHGAEGGPSLFGEDADPAGLGPAAISDDAPKEDAPKGKGAAKKRPVPTTATTMSETPTAKKRF